MIIYFSYLCGLSNSALIYFKVIIFSLFIHVLLGVVLQPFGYTQEIHGTFRLTGLVGGVQAYANIAMLLVVFSMLSIILKDHLVFSKGWLLIFVIVSLIAMVMSNTLKNFAAALLTISFLFFVFTW